MKKKAEELTPEQIYSEIVLLKIRIANPVGSSYKDDLMRLKFLRNKQTHIKKNKDERPDREAATE